MIEKETNTNININDTSCMSKPAALLREATQEDLAQILHLYLYLHEKTIPEDSQQLRDTWESIINDKNHHLIVCERDGKLLRHVYV